MVGRYSFVTGDLSRRTNLEFLFMIIQAWHNSSLRRALMRAIADYNRWTWRSYLSRERRGIGCMMLLWWVGGRPVYTRRIA